MVLQRPQSKTIETTASTKKAEKAAGEVVTTGSIGGKASKPKAPYGEIVERYASSYGVPVSLAHAVISVESNYRANARGKAGEIGLMQIKPATARMMGYSGSAKGLFNPETNIKFGMKYLAKAHALSGGTTCGTILKYNAGHAAKRMNPVSCSLLQQGASAHLAATKVRRTEMVRKPSATVFVCLLPSEPPLYAVPAGRAAAPARAERLRVRKVRAPWKHGAG